MKMKVPNKVVKFWLFVEGFFFGRGVRKTLSNREKRVLTTLELGKPMIQMLAGCLEYGTLYERIKAKRHWWGRGEEGTAHHLLTKTCSLTENVFKSPPICIFLPLLNVLTFQ